jgi:hypothetical protein
MNLRLLSFYSMILRLSLCRESKSARAPDQLHFEAPKAEHLRSFDVTFIPGFHDMWEEAQMGEVVEYLQGSYSLQLPEEWLACGEPRYEAPRASDSPES